MTTLPPTAAPAPQRRPPRTWRDIGRGLLWGLVAGTVVAVAGDIAGEPWPILLAFSLPTALLFGLLGTFRVPAEPPTDADRMSWLFAIVFRSIGRW